MKQIFRSNSATAELSTAAGWNASRKKNHDHLSRPSAHLGIEPKYWYLNTSATLHKNHGHETKAWNSLVDYIAQYSHSVLYCIVPCVRIVYKCVTRKMEKQKKKKENALFLKTSRVFKLVYVPIYLLCAYMPHVPWSPPSIAPQLHPAIVYQYRIKHGRKSIRAPSIKMHIEFSSSKIISNLLSFLERQIRCSTLKRYSFFLTLRQNHSGWIARCSSL